MKVEVKEVVQTPPPKEYVLTLNQEELDLIVYSLGHIGGDPKSKIRMTATPMWRQIEHMRQNSLEFTFRKTHIVVE